MEPTQNQNLDVPTKKKGKLASFMRLRRSKKSVSTPNLHAEALASPEHTFSTTFYEPDLPNTDVIELQNQEIQEKDENHDTFIYESNEIDNADEFKSQKPQEFTLPKSPTRKKKKILGFLGRKKASVSKTSLIDGQSGFKLDVDLKNFETIRDGDLDMQLLYQPIMQPPEGKSKQELVKKFHELHAVSPKMLELTANIICSISSLLLKIEQACKNCPLSEKNSEIKHMYEETQLYRIQFACCQMKEAVQILYEQTDFSGYRHGFLNMHQQLVEKLINNDGILSDVKRTLEVMEQKLSDEIAKMIEEAEDKVENIDSHVKLLWQHVIALIDCAFSANFNLSNDNDVLSTFSRYNATPESKKHFSDLYGTEEKPEYLNDAYFLPHYNDRVISLLMGEDSQLNETAGDTDYAKLKNTIPNGFKIKSTVQELRSLERKLDGKWGSYRLFERWLSEAMRWQFMDFKLQSKFCSQHEELQMLRNKKIQAFSNDVAKKIFQLWKGRVLQIETDTTELASNNINGIITNFMNSDKINQTALQKEAPASNSDQIENSVSKKISYNNKTTSTVKAEKKKTKKDVASPANSESQKDTASKISDDIDLTECETENNSVYCKRKTSASSVIEQGNNEQKKYHKKNRKRWKFLSRSTTRANDKYEDGSDYDIGFLHQTQNLQEISQTELNYADKRDGMSTDAPSERTETTDLLQGIVEQTKLEGYILEGHAAEMINANASSQPTQNGKTNEMFLKSQELKKTKNVSLTHNAIHRGKKFGSLFRKKDHHKSVSFDRSDKEIFTAKENAEVSTPKLAPNVKNHNSLSELHEKKAEYDVNVAVEVNSTMDLQVSEEMFEDVIELQDETILSSTSETMLKRKGQKKSIKNAVTSLKKSFQRGKSNRRPSRRSSDNDIDSFMASLSPNHCSKKSNFNTITNGDQGAISGLLQNKNFTIEELPPALGNVDEVVGHTLNFQINDPISLDPIGKNNTHGTQNIQSTNNVITEFDTDDPKLLSEVLNGSTFDEVVEDDNAHKIFESDKEKMHNDLNVIQSEGIDGNEMPDPLTLSVDLEIETNQDDSHLNREPAKTISFATIEDPISFVKFPQENSEIDEHRNIRGGELSSQDSFLIGYISSENLASPPLTPPTSQIQCVTPVSPTTMKPELEICLKHSAAFADCPKALIPIIVAEMKKNSATFNEGHQLYKEGHLIDTLYFIFVGSVQFGNAQETSICSSGHLLWEDEFLIQKCAPSDAVVTDYTILQSLPWDVYSNKILSYQANNRNIVRTALMQSTFFNSIPREDLEKLVTAVVVQEYAINEKVYSQDTVTDKLIIIVSGTLECVKDTGKETLVSGQMFGEDFLLQPAPSCSSVYVTSELSTVATLSSYQFQSIVDIEEHLLRLETQDHEDPINTDSSHPKRTRKASLRRGLVRKIKNLSHAKLPRAIKK